MIQEMRPHRAAALALLIAGVTVSCTREPLNPAEMTPRELAAAFAVAVVSDDFETARQLMCPGAPDPEELGPFPFEGPEFVGVPSSEPPPGTFITVSEPGPDLYVRFQATDDGEDVAGSIEVTLGAERCIESHGINRVRVEDGTP